MTTSTFGITFDYRCPFARNAHEHVVAGLRAGAPWTVDFRPFSLSQAHVEDGGTPVWEDPAKAPELIAIEAGIVVRDRFPDQFLDAHLSLFAVRHDDGEDLRDEKVVRRALERAGVDAAAVFEEIASGWPREAFRAVHEHDVSKLSVFGVPTFIIGERAVFVRLLTRSEGDGSSSVPVVDRVLDLIDDAGELNEFKYTRIPR